MDKFNIGLMEQDDTIIDNFRNAILGNQRPKTLTQLLGDLSPEDAAQVQSLARLTRMMSQTYVRSQGYMDVTYEDLVKQLHRGLRPDLQAIVAMLLEQIDPVEVREKPKFDRVAAQLSIYDDWNTSVSEVTGGIPEITDKDIAEFSAAAGLTKEAPEQLSFLDQLEASESSGKADAEITIKDGRRFVGKLQFGKARLQDYQKATGTTFTQDEFIKDTTLQDKVAEWHIADLDKAIDALGDVAADYDRDSLRAVAHLGGKSGMKKFVQSKGGYNPADELGTSLRSYYDKFSNRGDA
ncbi:hypothetical protein HIMB11_01068 [Rhodobacteraceae bacterium HIMB11]|nr:hypothetical protein HIMB11_01068 [Rhodobacteraceae bacterium HIMB11]